MKYIVDLLKGKKFFFRFLGREKFYFRWIQVCVIEIVSWLWPQIPDSQGFCGDSYHPSDGGKNLKYNWVL